MMNYQEAVEWLNGDRSMCNVIPVTNDGQWHVIVAQADAAMTQQAYWIVKAHRESRVVVSISAMNPRNVDHYEQDVCDE
jgi:hypothetical protein